MGTDDAGHPDARDAPGDAPISTTREYAGVDTHTLRRAVARALAAFADGGEPSSKTTENASEADATVVTRRAAVDAGAIPYRPYGPHSAMVIVVSFVFMIPTVFLSLLVAGLALYFYYRERPMDLPLERRDVVRVLVTDEATDETRTQSDANGPGVTVTYAADTFLSVDADRVADLSWSRRIATMNYVNYWYNLVADDPVERDVDDTVMGYLTAWANRDPQSHADTVRSFQQSFEDDLERQREYTDLLADQLPGVDDELEAGRESLQADLEALADELAVELERSGA